MSRKKIINDCYSEYFRIEKIMGKFTNNRSSLYVIVYVIPHPSDIDYFTYRIYLGACVDLFNHQKSLREVCKDFSDEDIKINRTVLDRFIHQEIPKINKDFYNDLCRLLKLNKRHTSSKKYKGKEDL